ncbi:MAG: AbrB/MazE/SpoVT family DNA-binding domain-containing protein, partial [Candidatus Heimdallarchaeota archaeon]
VNRFQSTKFFVIRSIWILRSIDFGIISKILENVYNSQIAQLIMKTKLSKNGMITLPSKIRKDLNIHVGDEIVFVEDDGIYNIIPVKKLEDLIDQDHKEGAKRILQSIREERDKDRE